MPQILCINKTDRFNPHEWISHIGGKTAIGNTWKITQERAIQGIESGEWQLFVSQEGKTVNIIVAKST